MIMKIRAALQETKIVAPNTLKWSPFWTICWKYSGKRTSIANVDTKRTMPLPMMRVFVSNRLDSIINFSLELYILKFGILSPELLGFWHVVVAKSQFGLLR